MNDLHSHAWLGDSMMIGTLDSLTTAFITVSILLSVLVQIAAAAVTLSLGRHDNTRRRIIIR